MLMPNDLKAEQSVIGSMIMEAALSFEIVTDAGITEAHFYNHHTAIMFAAAMQIGTSPLSCMAVSTAFEN